MQLDDTINTTATSHDVDLDSYRAARGFFDELRYSSYTTCARLGSRHMCWARNAIHLG